jgi:O-antigen ligase
VLTYAFVVSTVADAFTFSFLTSSDNVSRLLGLGLVVAYLVAMAGGLRLSLPGRDVRWYLAFFALAAGEEVWRVGRLAQADAELSLRHFVAFAQLALLFLVVRDASNDPRVPRGTFLAYLVSYGMVSLAVNVHLALVTQIEAGRVTFVGVNPNQLAYLAAAVAVVLLCRLLFAEKPLDAGNLPAVVAVGSLVLTVFYTGSRGGAVALVAGMGTAVLVGIRVRQLPAYLLVLPVLLSVGSHFAPSTGVLAERFEETLQERDTGKRLELLEAGIALVAESPVVGHGASYVVGLGDVMGWRAGVSAHNTYLEVVLSFGILGLLPFVGGVFATLATSWAGRGGLWGAALLSLVVMTVAFGTVGHLALTKHFWILMAFAGNPLVVARAATEAGGKGRRGSTTLKPWAEARIGS